jgi:hypothetical protein
MSSNKEAETFLKMMLICNKKIQKTKLMSRTRPQGIITRTVAVIQIQTKKITIKYHLKVLTCQPRNWNSALLWKASYIE